MPLGYLLMNEKLSKIEHKNVFWAEAYPAKLWVWRSEPIGQGDLHVWRSYEIRCWSLL